MSPTREQRCPATSPLACSRVEGLFRLVLDLGTRAGWGRGAGWVSGREGLRV